MNFACNSNEFLISFQIFPPGCFQGQHSLEYSKRGQNISCKRIPLWSALLKWSKGLFLDQSQIKPCHYLRGCLCTRTHSVERSWFHLLIWIILIIMPGISCRLTLVWFPVGACQVSLGCGHSPSVAPTYLQREPAPEYSPRWSQELLSALNCWEERLT